MGSIWRAAAGDARHHLSSGLLPACAGSLRRRHCFLSPAALRALGSRASRRSGTLALAWRQRGLDVFFQLIADTRVSPVRSNPDTRARPQDLSALEARPKMDKGRLMQDAVVPHLLSDSGIEQLVFAGPLAGELKHCASPCPPQGAAYVVDYSALVIVNGFATRPGEITHGATAYSSSSGRLLDVRGARDAGSRPEDARQMFVVSGALRSTVCHPLLLIHFVTSGTLNRVFHALLKLPVGANHTLTAALGPFVASSTRANFYAALSLLEEGGQALRVTSLSAPGAVNVSRFSLQRRFTTIAEDFEARGLSNLGDAIHPVRLDLTELESIFQRFVLRTISAEWKTDEDLAKDVGPWSSGERFAPGPGARFLRASRSSASPARSARSSQ
jgi:hypothetical protein